MSGTGLQFRGERSEEWFYVPLKARKSQNQKQNKKQQQQYQRPIKSDENDSLRTKTNESWVSNDVVSASEPSMSSRSNLERFLGSTTPYVPAQYLSKLPRKCRNMKTTMRGRRTCDVEFLPYFTLGDLWESFKEWSAYGAGVPLILDGSNDVVQYYVPYLSGIQLYSESTTSSSPKSRQASDDSDSDYYEDSCSDGSSDYEFQKGMKFSREIHAHPQHTNGVAFRAGSVSTSDEHSNTQEGFSSENGEIGNSRVHLLFEFLEQATPYSREPLTDKILDLACQYPGLNTLRSCDLLPISWISVAWYPIYRIPTGPTLKDLNACFLTYHSPSTPLGGSGGTPGLYPSDFDTAPKFSLPVFGLASYKFKGSMWAQNGAGELQLANSLMQAANNWLRLLQVSHPDFQFFASHGMYIGDTER